MDYEYSRNIPIEITSSANNYSSSGASYGGSASYGGASSISTSSAIDANLLQHENPNNCTDLAPALPLEQYKLNVDNNPHIIRKKPAGVQYLQEIAVKYLKPPPAPRGGDIIIKQLPSRQIAPAPALVQRIPGQRAPTPPPLVIREAPPQPPAPLPGRTITIPGKIIPPPARKVIVEKLPSEPAKPQNILIERWLPYGPQTQRIIYQPARAPCIIPDPRNIVIQWENPDVEIKKEFKNLGVHLTDPRDYIARYGSSLIRSDQLPEIAIRYSSQAGVTLAANARQEGPIVEGDLQALRLIDLDRNGLQYLRNRVGSMPNLASESYYSNEQQYSSSSSSYTAESDFIYRRNSPSSIQYESEYHSNEIISL